RGGPGPAQAGTAGGGARGPSQVDANICSYMAHAPHLREKARALRAQRKLTIDELAERLALSRSTIYYWVRDLPLERKGRANAGQRRGSRAMQRKYRLMREEAYREGLESFDALVRDPSFRDFVSLYIAEGYKRDRNRVPIA